MHERAPGLSSYKCRSAKRNEHVSAGYSVLVELETLVHERLSSMRDDIQALGRVIDRVTAAPRRRVRRDGLDLLSNVIKGKLL